MTRIALVTDPHDAKWRRPDRKGESFWSTNLGWFFGRGDERAETASPDDVEFEFVKVEKLPGLRRWRVSWRGDPLTPWPVTLERFVSGPAKSIIRDAIAFNAKLKARYDAAQKDTNMRDRMEQRNRHEQQIGGKHTSGDWWDCPVCNPDRGVNRQTYE